MPESPCGMWEPEVLIPRAALSRESLPYSAVMVRLDQKQRDTLVTIVELVRSVPRNQRHSFYLAETNQYAALVMPGARTQPHVLAADVRELFHAGLIRFAPGGGRNTTAYDVTPTGFAYYDALMTEAGGQTATIEKQVTRYLDSQDFSARHRDSYGKWSQAAKEVRGDDTERRMTSVGHHVREAMMAFAAECVALYGVADAPIDLEKTLHRLRAVIAEAAPRLGDTERPMLDALVTYWGTVHDLAARQEHGAAKAVPLVVEDARRVVFHTAMVMFELDRAFVRAFSR